MAAELRLLIVLLLARTDNQPLSETMLSELRGVVEGGSPDLVCTDATQVTGYFIPSPAATERVKSVIDRIAALRIADPKKHSLGIGLSLGKLIVDCNWLGNISKSNHLPMGNANVDAWKIAQRPQAYLDILDQLPR